MKIRALLFAPRPFIKMLRIMRMIGFLLLVGVLHVSATGLSQSIHFSGKKVSIKEVFRVVEKQTDYVFFFDDMMLAGIKPVDVRADNMPLETFLAEVFKDLPLRFSFQNKTIVVSRQLALRSKDPGRIAGRVTDEDNGEPVIGATIRIKDKVTTTDIKGSFSLSLPPGIYSATVSYVGYNTREITEIEVKEKQVFQFQVTLRKSTRQLEAVVVTSSARKETIAALYARQKNNAAITDGISAEQIARTPDNNAAQVLKRVSGLTVQDEKYVTIRGLSDRYNSVLLNGSMLPSTEPNRRNFSFDIIPSGLIDNIVVHKTATPDMSSEFAGGLVQVNTKDIPVENYYNITLGTGLNTNSVGKDMYSAKRGKNDYLGYDDGTKTWWKKQHWSFPEYVKALRESRERVGELGRQIPNNWNIYKYQYSPVQNYQFNIGHKLPLKNGANIGIVFGALYRHEEAREEEQRKTYATEEYDFKGNNYVFRSSLGGVFNIAYQAPKHKLAFKNLYNHLFVNETSDARGPMPGFTPGTYRNSLFITNINALWQHRLEGEHALGSKGMKLDWSADRITVTRDQPDTRNAMGLQIYNRDNLYDYEGLRDRTGSLSRGLSMFNSRLTETRYNWMANFVVPFTIKGLQQRIKAGYAGAYREANFESFGIAAIKYYPDDLDPDFDKNTFGLPVYRLLAPEFIRPGYIYYDKTIYDGNNYDGIQRMQAGYLMLDARLFSKLRFIGGVRAEDNTMFVNSQFFVEGRPIDNYTYHKLDWLPSANLVYTLNAKMNVRAAVSQTLSRPDFRERAAFQYFEFKTRTDYKGALGLKDARITNIDLRYEFYPSAGEIISLSLFHKHFASPVELVAAQGSGSLIYFYFNLKSSVSKGLEIDFRKSLNFIHPTSSILSNIYISGNASWMKANVKYNIDQMLKAANGVTGGNETELPGDSRNRPVQGLSPSIYNLGLGYVGKPIGFQASYNRYGKRIISGGLYPWQDEYENPRDVLDLQLNAALLKNKLNLRFNVGDLLQQPFIIYNNFTDDDPKGTDYNPDKDFTRYRSKRGINLSFNAAYNF